MGQIQDRMPVIIEPENWPLWVGEVIGNPVTLLRPAAEGVLRFWPVDKKVGNVWNDEPDLIEPVLEMKPTLI
jgi:putative SOS response-associated peptidase YedK